MGYEINKYDIPFSIVN